MFENLVKKSLAALGEFFDNLTAERNAPADGVIKYDMVINRVNEDGDEVTSKRTYKTALSRQIAAQQLVEQSRTAVGDDDDDGTSFDDQSGITSLVFEDRLVYWRNCPQTPTIPSRIPRLEGKGDYVLRCDTNKSTIEITGLSNPKMLTAIESMAQRLETTLSTAAVIRRHVAFKRKLVLCAAD
jgi:hypothetical protein